MLLASSDLHKAFITANINTGRGVVNGCDATMVSVTVKPGGLSIATCLDDAARLAGYSVMEIEFNQPFSINVVLLLSEDKRRTQISNGRHWSSYERPWATDQLNAAAALQF